MILYMLYFLCFKKLNILEKYFTTRNIGFDSSRGYRFFVFLLWLTYPLVLDSVCIFLNAMKEWYIWKRYDSGCLIAK